MPHARIVTFSIAAQLRVADLHLLEKHLAAVLRDAAEDRLARGGRLLEDLLEHEVLVAGLLRHDRIPEDALRRLGDRPAEKVGERHARARDDRHLFVAEEDHVARVAEDGRDVGGDEELAVAEADDDRRAVSNGDDLFGVVGRDQHQGEQPAHQQQRAPHRILEPVVFHLAFDQVRDDLRVGFGDELVALALQLVLQIEVVLDDAVVDDDDLAGAIAVGMGVLFGRPAVRRPARVADAVVAGERMFGDDVFELRQLARAAPELDRTVVDHGHAGRVVAAIFEPAQAVDEDRHDVLRADVTDDSAHIYWSFFFFLRSAAPAFDVPLLAGADRQGAGRDVLADGRAAADIRAFADRDRRDELRVAADERAVLDRGLVLGDAVVVARDGSGADVHVRADRRVAEIAEVHRLRSGAEHRLLQLDEVADPRALGDDGVVSQVRERTDARLVRHRGVRDHAVVVNRHAVADARIDDAHAAVDLAAAADRRLAFERHAGMDDRVASDVDMRIHVGRRRILNRDAGGHQLLVLRLSHDSAHCRQLEAAVDSPDFVGVRHGQRFDAEPALPVERNDVGQVVLALRVFRRDAGQRLEQPVEGERVDACVDFADRALGRAGIPLLDDTSNLAGQNARFARIRAVHRR